MPQFSVCIATISGETIGAAITSIRSQALTDWELIVVGQGASLEMRRIVNEAADDDAEARMSAKPRIHYIHLETKGTTVARNAAIAFSTGDYVAFIDDDCEADKDWLSGLLEGFVAVPDAELVAGPLVAPPMKRGRFASCPQVSPSFGIYRPNRQNGVKPPQNWDWVGSNLAIHRSVFDKFGAFDPFLGPGTDFPAAEDTDFKLRLEDEGVTMVTVPYAKVRHTYGVRYGIKAMLKHSRNYARGNAGLAGKLTLAGDPRGDEWLKDTSKIDWNPTRLIRVLSLLPMHFYRLYWFRNAYELCLQKYVYDKPSRSLVVLSEAGLS